MIEMLLSYLPWYYVTIGLFITAYAVTDIKSANHPIGDGIGEFFLIFIFWPIIIFMMVGEFLADKRNAKRDNNND